MGTSGKFIVYMQSHNRYIHTTVIHCYELGRRITVSYQSRIKPESAHIYSSESVHNTQLLWQSTTPGRWCVYRIVTRIDVKQAHRCGHCSKTQTRYGASCSRARARTHAQHTSTHHLCSWHPPSLQTHLPWH